MDRIGSVKPDAVQVNEHWAYRRPQNVVAPAVKTDSWPQCDIDRYVLSVIEAKGLNPVADADRATLLRRLSFVRRQWELRATLQCKARSPFS